MWGFPMYGEVQARKEFLPDKGGLKEMEGRDGNGRSGEE